MNRRLTARVVRSSFAAAAVLVLLAVCDNGDNSAPVPSLSDTFADSGLNVTTAGRNSATVSGRVVDAAGAPVANVPVSMCATVCWPTTTGPDGEFYFADLPVESYAVDVRGDRLAGRLLLSTIFPWDVVAGTQGLAVPVTLHEPFMPSGWDGRGSLSIAGLRLAPTKPMDVEELLRLTGDVVIGGALIPPEDWPQYSISRDGRRYEPLLMWALRPFGHVLRSPIEVSVEEDLLWRFEPEATLFVVDVVTGHAIPVAESATFDVVSWVILASPARSL